MLQDRRAGSLRLAPRPRLLRAVRKEGEALFFPRVDDSDVGPRPPTEPSLLIVRERLADVGRSAAHKWTMLHDWFFQIAALEHKHTYWRVAGL